MSMVPPRPERRRGLGWSAGISSKGGKPSSSLQPVLEQVVKDVARDPFPLPNREIGISDRQRRQRGWRSGRKRAVQNAEVVQQHRSPTSASVTMWCMVRTSTL